MTLDLTRARIAALLAVAAYLPCGACGGSTEPGGARGGSTGSSTSWSSTPSTWTGSTTSVSSATTATSCASHYFCDAARCSVVFDSNGCGIGCACESASSGSGLPDCGAPTVTTYDCQPLPPEVAGCPVQTDAGDVHYPFGCNETLPGCSIVTGYQTPVTCTCMESAAPGASAGFVCPL